MVFSLLRGEIGVVVGEEWEGVGLVVSLDRVYFGFFGFFEFLLLFVY